MINGTKLLNAFQVSRGRSDGVLKKVKVRFVNKTGPAKLKGIPIDEAILIAKNEASYDSLYPLFEPNINAQINLSKSINNNIKETQAIINTDYTNTNEYNTRNRNVSSITTSFNGVNDYPNNIHFDVNKRLILNGGPNNRYYSAMQNDP